MKPLTAQIRSLQQHSLVYPEFFNLGYGELHLKFDQSSGMIAMIAVHSTRLGPALGGCRFISYATLDDAILDCIRLAQGMSYKAAIHGLPIGGGKAVVIKPEPPFQREKIFHAFGQFVHDLGGRFITAEDSGTAVADMDQIRTITPYVTGNTSQRFLIKDPSLLTALGVRRGIQAAVKHHLHRSSLEGTKVAIQGLGHVGYHLAKELHLLGAQLWVTDHHNHLIERCQQEFKATPVQADAIHRQSVDVFAPCALGSSINPETIEEIQATIIAGSANNQLADPDMALILHRKGILYAPDYVINAGGLIHVSCQRLDKSEQDAKDQIEKIYQLLMSLFEEASRLNLSPLQIANNRVEKILGLA
jgi:leucine dehydrogenase